MNKKILTLMAGAASAVLAANAQELKNEVVIEREVEPQERLVTRPASVTPSLFSPRIVRQQLNLSEYTGTGQLHRSLSMLEPAAYADTFAVSPYRGYAMLGYFPTYNLEASAGYRFIDTKNSTVGAWLQYDGNSYNMATWALPESPLVNTDAEKVKLNRHFLTIGAYGEQRFKAGSLGLDLDYMHASVSQPMIADDLTQSANRFRANLGWQAASSALPWHLGANVGVFGFAKDIVYGTTAGRAGELAPDPKKPSETVFGVNGGISWVKDSHSWNLDIDAKFQSLNSFNSMNAVATTAPVSGTLVPEWSITGGKGVTLGVTNIRPRYHLGKEKFTLDLGLNVSIGSGGDDTGATFNPDVLFAWTPTQQASVWVRGKGERVLNTLSDMFEYNPYQLSTITYGHSDYYDALAGINLGPVKGFTFEGWVGYSAANNWLTPCVVDYVPLYVGHDMDGFRYGARVGWQWKDKLQIAVQAEGVNNSDIDDGYYMWRDHARWVVGAELRVTPTKALDITVDWNLRTGRRSFSLTPEVYSQDFPYTYWTYERVDLGDVNELNVEARYRISEPVSVFARVNNCLAKRWTISPGVLSQRLHGLVGVALKF